MPKHPFDKNRRIRKSQLVTTFGIGSIVEFPEESLMHAGLDAWPEEELQCYRLEDKRLSKRLGVKYFLEPPVGPVDRESRGEVVPFVRFPLWHYCPSCRELTKLEWNDRQVSQCPTCSAKAGGFKKKLIPLRFVQACESGHISDFPWVEWVHKAAGQKLSEANVCSAPKLRLSTGGVSSGLQDIKIQCLNCSAKASLSGASDVNALKDLGCSGERPWLGNNSREECEQTPRMVQRGASNIYFSQQVSSILLPEVEDLLAKEIDKYWNKIKAAFDAGEQVKVDSYVSVISDTVDKTEDVVLARINALLNGSSNDEEVSETEYRYEEFLVLSDKKDIIEHGILNLISHPSENYDINFAKFFKGIVKVEKLTETRSLVGFSRLSSPNSTRVGEGNLSKLSNKKKDWLPAIRVKGEGIFISFDEDSVKEWSSRPGVLKRIDHFQRRHNEVSDQMRRTRRVITPREILIHTFAHLLIRQLSFDCGYGSSSLRERLYCSDSEDHAMAAVLIYTAASDSEGTLGGLVEQADPGVLEETVRKALVNALHCSSDPLCLESDGQGSDSLNLAACHACALLPETSCEEGNRLLDRVLVVGSLEEDRLGYFEELIENY